MDEGRANRVDDLESRIWNFGRKDAIERQLEGEMREMKGDRMKGVEPCG